MTERRKKPRDDFDYTKMRRAELISRLKACRDCFHKIAEECRDLRKRLEKQSDLRKYLHG